MWLLLKIRLVPLLMQTFSFPVAVASWTVPEQDREYVTSLQRDIASQQHEQSEERGWVTTLVTHVRLSVQGENYLLPQRAASKPSNSSFSFSKGFQLRVSGESLCVWRLAYQISVFCHSEVDVTEDFSFYFGGCFLFCFPC